MNATEQKMTNANLETTATDEKTYVGTEEDTLSRLASFLSVIGSAVRNRA